MAAALMTVIGLTGGIASGKSTVAKMLTALGAEIIDADRLAREAVEPGGPAYAAVVADFGPTVVAADGHLDREHLAALIFDDPGRRKHLESLIHPYVLSASLRRQAEIAQNQPDALIFWDVPLLFESGMDRGLVEIVVVYLPRSVQLERLMTRDHLSEAAARARIGAQMDLELKRRRATRVIDNSGGIQATRIQVERLYRDLIGSNSG
jgi:dephospho-CoA kinase